MPTSPQVIFSASRLEPAFDADNAMDSLVDVKLKASTTFVKGTIVGEISASPGTYGAYASGNTDGTQNPTGIIQYGGTTDANSNITDSEWGTTADSVPMFTKGAFHIEDLTGYDSTVAGKLGGHVIEDNSGAGTGLIVF